MKYNQVALRTFVFQLFILAILASCTTTKQLHQDKTNITTETSMHETSVSNSQIISNTLITESQDTSVFITGSELSNSVKFNSLLSGDTIFATDANLMLKTFYDSLTKTIKTQVSVKPQTVSFKYQKITERQELRTNSATATKQEQDKQIVQSVNKDKEITRSSIPLWFMFIIIVAVISIIIWFFYKLKRYV